MSEKGAVEIVGPTPSTPTPNGPRTRQGRGGSMTWLFGAILAGLTIVEGVRQGGFWRADAFVVAVVALPILVIQTVLQRRDRRALAVAGSLVLLAAWWLVRAGTVSTVGHFLPLGASVIGFGATFVTVRRLTSSEKELVGLLIAVLGTAGSLVGFAGLIWRWFPEAMPAQGLWRLSSTITYADAAGLILGVCLLMALAGGTRPWVARLAVCLCAGGLLATQSRGAYVAFAVGCGFVPLRQYRQLLRPLIAGALLGAVAIMTSPSVHAVPWLGVTLIAAVAVSVVRVPIGVAPAGKWARMLVLGSVAVVAIGAVVLLHHEIALRALAPSDQDRTVEWTAAVHQFRSSPLIGVGPDKLLRFHAVDGTFAHFVHNEYLQIAADAGVIGIAILLAVILSLVRTVRRVDVLTSCAVAALVCVAMAGAFDFDWHLPFVGLLSGSVAGLASRRIT